MNKEGKSVSSAAWRQHSVLADTKKSSVSIRFQPDLQDDIPGVYRLERIKDGKVLYVGEASNLRKRLVFLFRANSPKNPHPFHSHCIKAKGKSLGYKDMCSLFRVSVLSTVGLRGRVEIEEEEKARHQTNHQRFYRSNEIEPI
jgi:hypothetical protein